MVVRLSVLNLNSNVGNSAGVMHLKSQSGSGY